MLLSIMIPSYNHEHFVLSTIQTAASIDIQDKEIIVIDDGSSDDSVRVIREYIANAGATSNIRLITRENRGLVKTLNQGLSISRGKYFYVISSDDIPIPEGIANLVGILEADPSLRFVLGNALFMEFEQQCEFRTSYGESHRRFFLLPDNRRRKELFLHYPHPLLLQSTVFRTTALKGMNGWSEDIILDDMSLFTRIFSHLAMVDRDFEFHPEIMACFYRQHQTNISKNQSRQFLTIQQLLERLCPPELQDAAFVRNFIDHGVAALKKGSVHQAMQFLGSTVSRVGFFRLIYTSVPELREILVNKFSRRTANKIEPMVVHEPAADLIKRTRRTPECF